MGHNLMECWFWCVFQCVDACIDVVKEVFDVELRAALFVEDVSAVRADVAHERKRRTTIGTVFEVAAFLGNTKVFAADDFSGVDALDVWRRREALGFLGFL